MQFPHQKSFLTEYGLSIILTLAIFILDLLTPSGVVEWLLYAVPLALTLSASRIHAPLYWAGVITLLIIVGYAVSPPGVLPLYSAINRLLGIGLMWAFAVALVSRRLTQVQAAATREQMAHELTVVQAERTQAESAKEAAVQARAHAEAAVLGAVAGQRRAEEETLEERLRLEGVVQSAMDAIITIDEAERIILFNQAAEQMFKWQADEVLGQPLNQLIPERFRAAHTEHIRQFGRSCITNRQMGALGMVVGLRADGIEFPIEAAISQVAVSGHRYYTVILRDITGRRRLEQELAEREALLRAIVEAEPECVKVLDLNGVVRTINAAGLAMVGASGTQEIVGTDACDLVADEFRPAFRSLIRQAGLGTAGRLQFEMVGLKGRRRWLETHAVPLSGVDGAIHAVLGVTRDVTEQKKAETLLRQSEERYRRLLAVLPDAILVIRGDRIIYLNEQGQRLFGRTLPADLMGKSPYDLLHQSCHDSVRARLRHLLETGSTFPEEEAQIVRCDGTVVDVGLSASYFRDEEGGGILLLLRDITERKLAEQRVRESEERLQSLLDAMEDVVWSSALDLSAIYYISPSAAQIYGRPAEDFIRQPGLWTELIHAEDRPSIERALQDLRTTGEFDVEYRVGLLNGETRWVHDRRRIIKDEAGRPLRIDGIATDITERKHLQAQLRRTERVAELGTVASGMAHEIGTPMNVILGRAEYLMERTKEESVKKGLQTIVSQVERITRVMSQLLAFARRRPVEHRALDLRQTIEDNLEIFQERLAHNDITAETEFADDCPLVHADGDQMSQVLINLVMNAIHAMPTGGRLRVALAPDRGVVKLTVADTGHGMPRDIIAKIFDPFFTTKEFGKGTGLGLTVVKGIIEEHGGTIQVESEPDQGTRFTICLPLHADKGAVTS
ncbi:MAG: PAS domain S-box protein [Nitrospira sp.]|nr:MAG: PAS domain S-box protein [Nitrospira sp.]